MEIELVEEIEILLALRVNKMRLAKAVEVVICYNRVLLIKLIIDLICLILIKIREIKDWLLASIDEAFSILKERLAYTRLEDVGRHYRRYNQNLQVVKGCEHGWRYENTLYIRKWVVPLFCHWCLEFVDDCDDSKD